MRVLTYIIPLIFFVIACGGEPEQESTYLAEDEEGIDLTDVTDDQDVRTIEIIGINQMKFVVEEEGEMIGTANTIEASNGETYLLLDSIEASPGERLEIQLTTISEMPARAMAHNWVLLEKGVDASAFAQDATAAVDNDYIPQDRTDQIIAYTDMAAGGETVEVTFTVPEETGEYEYICSFPAHYSASMKGILSVQ